MLHLREKYIELINCDEPFYLKQGYTIEQFAADLHTNRSYASRFINNEFEVNFATLLSDLRLSHFIKLKNENPKAKIKEIAIKSGFLNIYTFRRVFKKKYGITATEYFAQK